MDNFPEPVSDPEAEGLPDTADDDRTAYDDVDSPRIYDGPDPAALPGDSPLAVDRYGVTPEEAEDVFFHEPLVVRSDPRHSKSEKRYYGLGQTAAGRRLFLAFTIRRKRIRVISVRDMNRNEAEVYRTHEKEAS